MLSKNLALALAVAGLVAGTAQAKKTPPPAPNLSAGASILLEVATETEPGSISSVDAVVKYNLSHSFTITPEQEASILADTGISLLGISITPSEDPKFENGDKSFSFVKMFPPLIDGAEEMPVSIKAKWGKGKFAINLKVNWKAKDIPSAPTLAELTKLAESGKAGTLIKAASAKESPVISVYTAFAPSSASPFEVEAFMAANAEGSQSQSITADGVEIETQSQSINTEFFVNPPIE